MTAQEPTSTRRDCPTCHSRDVTENHIGWCAVRTAARVEAQSLGDAQSIPSVTTDDLWAHLGHASSSPQDATRIVRQVIDLGWRPVVGSDPKRLWNGGTR